MKKSYLQPEVEIVMTMVAGSYLITTSNEGENLLDDGGNTGDSGITEGDVKGSVFEEDFWQ